MSSKSNNLSQLFNVSNSGWDAKDVTSLTFGLTTVLINFLVLYIAFRHIDLRTKLNQNFIVSMTLADLIYGAAFMCTQPFVQFMTALWLCGPYYITIWTCSLGSVLFLLLLNLDKFISLRCPLRYPSIVTERSVLFQIFVAWSLVLIVSTFCYVGLVNFRSNASHCADVSIFPLYYGIFTLTCYAVPLLISLAVSVYIFWIAQTAGSAEGIEGKLNQQKRRRLFVKRVLFVFSSTIWTSVTSLPYRLAFTGYMYCVYSNQNFSNQEATYGLGTDACVSAGEIYMINIFLHILKLGSLVNPIVTIVTQRVYRSHVMRMLASCCRCISFPEPLLMLHPSTERRLRNLEHDTTGVEELHPLNEPSSSAAAGVSLPQFRGETPRSTSTTIFEVM